MPICYFIFCRNRIDRQYADACIITNSPIKLSNSFAAGTFFLELRTAPLPNASDPDPELSKSPNPEAVTKSEGYSLSTRYLSVYEPPEDDAEREGDELG